MKKFRSMQDSISMNSVTELSAALFSFSFFLILWFVKFLEQGSKPKSIVS